MTKGKTRSRPWSSATNALRKAKADPRMVGIESNVDPDGGANASSRFYT